MFRVPTSFLPPGTKSGDFVTALSPQLNILNKSDLGDTKFNIGVSGNVYANNSSLNYISTNANLNSDLTRWIRELIPGARLQIADSFLFTPEPPGFVTGVRPDTPSDAFARGVVAFRANTYTNYAVVSGQYAFTHSLGMQASYSNSIYRVAQVFQPQPSATISSFFFDSIVHSGSIGPAYRLTRSDTISLNYRPTYMLISQEEFSTALNVHSAIAEYTKEIKGWKAIVNGGPAFLEQGSRVFFTGNASLLTNYDPSTSLRLTVSRQFAPAFYAVAGGLISNMAGISIEHKPARQFVLTATANYSQNLAVPIEIFKYNSLLIGTQLTYLITRNLSTSIAYDYEQFTISSGSSGAVSGTGPGTTAALQGFEFDRHAVTLSITSTWK